MRLLTLNLRHGGGTRMPALLKGLQRHRADLMVLTEFRNNPAGAHLREKLAETGLLHQAAALAVPRLNNVLVASREPFRVEAHRLLRFDAARMLRVRLGRFDLVAVHLPNLKAKIPHWAALLKLAREMEVDGAPAIFSGDFNTGLFPLDGEGFRFTCEQEMATLQAMGWADAWRSLHPKGRDYTWYSHRGRGFRLDHTFLSPALAPRLGKARFDHRFRDSGASDHSALLVELDL